MNNQPPPYYYYFTMSHNMDFWSQLNRVLHTRVDVKNEYDPRPRRSGVGTTEPSTSDLMERSLDELLTSRTLASRDRSYCESDLPAHRGRILG